MSKKISAKQFCDIYYLFWKNKLTSPEQLLSKNLNGQELHEFCEFYFKQKLDESTLQHFYSCRKRDYILIGLAAGFLFSIVTFKLLSTTL